MAFTINFTIKLMY